MERLMRTLKEEVVWLQEWRSHQQLHQAVGKWVKGYIKECENIFTSSASKNLNLFLF